MKKLVTILAALMIAFSTVSPAYAWDVSKSKTGDKVDLTPDDKQVEITISLPSEESKDVFDIVFVIDNSNETAILQAKAKELLNELLAEGLRINVAVIKFTGRYQDMIERMSNGQYSGLTLLDSSNEGVIQQAIDTPIDRSLSGRGTNIPAGLEKGLELLDNSDTPDDHKYLIMLTDARSYIYNDEQGEPASIYAAYTKGGFYETYLTKGSEVPLAGWAVQCDKYGKVPNTPLFKSAELNDEFHKRIVSFSSMDELLNATGTVKEELEGTAGDQHCYYADPAGSSPLAQNNKLPITVTRHPVANYAEYIASGNLYDEYFEYTPTDGNAYQFYEVNVLEVEPVETETDANPVYQYTGKLNDNYYMFHVSGEEKSIYRSAKLWLEAGEKYHTFAIGNNRDTIREGGYLSGVETAGMFLQWLPRNSEFYAEATDGTGLPVAFDALQNQMIYTLGKGEVLDVISPYLDLVKNTYGAELPFAVYRDGEQLPITKLEDNAWGFGELIDPKDGIYEYMLVYFDDLTLLEEISVPDHDFTDIKGTGLFDWAINVPVENAHRVELKYKLEWNMTGPVDTLVDTNSATVLAYINVAVDIPHEDDERQLRGKDDAVKVFYEDFVSPQVRYRIPTPPTGDPATIALGLTALVGSATGIGSYLISKKNKEEDE